MESCDATGRSPVWNFIEPTAESENHLGTERPYCIAICACWYRRLESLYATSGGRHVWGNLTSERSSEDDGALVIPLQKSYQLLQPFHSGLS